MTSSLNKDIWCQVRLCSFLCLQITRSNARPPQMINWAVSLMIADGHFNSSTVICLGRYGLTYLLYHPQELQSDLDLGFTNSKCYKLSIQ